tara:strand:+ start:2140 stop:2952 length:813 start_codon:yes stop_codon:yes gene_type:complete
MITVEIVNNNKEIRVGDRVGAIQPNIFEDCLLAEKGVAVGFYISDIGKYSEKLKKLMTLADAELRSERVPKSLLERTDVFNAVYREGKSRKQAKAEQTVQYSTIIGNIPAKPHMRRPYHNKSSVHSVESAKPFVKAMRLAADEMVKIIKDVCPEIYDSQIEAIKNIPEKWKFGEMFTSSISNYNISAPIHIDKGNVVPSYNCIYTTRINSTGGCLYVPEYEAIFEQPNNSLLVYPAWRNKHGVTDIVPTHDGGYRNSLVFYALKAFMEKE